jgi:hypothetical protein
MHLARRLWTMVEPYHAVIGRRRDPLVGVRIAV